MTMAHPPAVVIVARHGMRLDAADHSWHMSTPTPYDPPLTYGGWNQSRALGVRIASLLHARELALNTASDATDPDMNGGAGARRRRRKHKIVIHTSPFLRCLQTSVAISAGIAQFDPPNTRPGSARSVSTMHSASPRLKAKDAPALPILAPIHEPSHGFQKDLARRALADQKPRHRQSKIRVDAWLGEWLNPQYFDHITPPPPSSMMVASAKAELMHNESLDAFTPVLAHKHSGGNLWGANDRPSTSGEGTLDDWSEVKDALEVPMLHRERSSSVSSFGSNDGDHPRSASGRRSPFRPGHTMQRFKSYLQPETALYQPPTPSYAISISDTIPKGYVTHARDAATNIDYHWDSSRPPQSWGDGGEYGEEWSSMHRRFRKGLSSIAYWYSQHNADDRGEDALGFDQADRHHEETEEQEDLVVILVTHAAGCNALIGALTSQPVLLDVGMASLTMAVRRDNAPPLLSPSTSEAAGSSPDGISGRSLDPAFMKDQHRRRSADVGLSAVYDMRLVASSEHLRPGADLTKAPTSPVSPNMPATKDALSRDKLSSVTSQGHLGASTGANRNSSEANQRRSNTSTALGSIRRPSASSLPTRASIHNTTKTGTISPDSRPYTPPTFTTGLWTPPSGRGTPQLSAQRGQEERKAIFSQLNEGGNGRPTFGADFTLSPTSPPDSPPVSSNGYLDGQIAVNEEQSKQSKQPKQQDSVIEETEDLGVPLVVSERVPMSLNRGLSQKGLWGNRPTGDRVVRQFTPSPKRRWTEHQGD